MADVSQQQQTKELKCGKLQRSPGDSEYTSMFLAEVTNDWTEVNKPNRCFSNMSSQLQRILRIFKRPIHLPQIVIDELIL